MINYNIKMYSGNKYSGTVVTRKIKMLWKQLQFVRLSVTLWTVALQAPLSIEFSRQELLEWVAIPFSKGSSWLRDWTQISYIAGGFFTAWDTREAHLYIFKPTYSKGPLPTPSVAFYANSPDSILFPCCVLILFYNFLLWKV